MPIDRGILLDLVISSSTYATKRNEEEQHSVYDITDNENFLQQNFTLDANNTDFDNSESFKDLGPVESFLYIYAPYTAVITLTKGAEEITFNMVNVLIISAAFDAVRVQNNDLTNPLSVKVIIS